VKGRRYKMECKKCNINIGNQDIILKVDEKIIFHVIVSGRVDPNDVLDKIKDAILDYVKNNVKEA
jgi:hypothetical protein